MVRPPALAGGGWRRQLRRAIAGGRARPAPPAPAAPPRPRPPRPPPQAATAQNTLEPLRAPADKAKDEDMEEERE